MAVGLPLKTTYADGDVYKASDVNDTNGTINQVAVTNSKYAGKNKIINGDFGIWQRGTSFTPSTATYTADRWYANWDNPGSTRTISQQAFTPGTAPVAGYESAYFLRYAVSVVGTPNSYSNLQQKIEDVRTFAGQTVTFSFWAKAAATTSITVLPYQNFGSGGSSDVYLTASPTISVGTSWTRYTYSYTLPSLTGKTIGAGSYMGIAFQLPISSTFTLDFWGVQLEAGSTATAFQTATGTIQGELAACQRYYNRMTDTYFGNAWASSSTRVYGILTSPVTMRVAPSFNAVGTFYITTTSNLTVTSIGLDNASPTRTSFTATVASGLTSGGGAGLGFGSSSVYIELSAEL